MAEGFSLPRGFALRNNFRLATLAGQVKLTEAIAIYALAADILARQEDFKSGPWLADEIAAVLLLPPFLVRRVLDEFATRGLIESGRINLNYSA